MRRLRSHILVRSAWLLMALHIFNCSVDTPDAQPDGQAEDLSINDMESIVEVVCEQMLDMENAVPEHDEPDGDGQQLKKSLNLYRDPVFCAVLLATHSSEILLRHPATDGWAGLPCPQPAPPPPWG